MYSEHVFPKIAKRGAAKRGRSEGGEGFDVLVPSVRRFLFANYSFDCHCKFLRVLDGSDY